MLEMGTNYTFALHIALFAIYRLKTILNPYKVVDVSKVKLFICMGLLWFFSFALSAPGLYYAAVRAEGKNSFIILLCYLILKRFWQYNFQIQRSRRYSFERSHLVRPY